MSLSNRGAPLPGGWAMVVARILTGWVFIEYGWFSKLKDPHFVPGMAETLRKMAEHSAFGFYRPLLERFALPHATAFAYLTGGGEAALGIALLLGAFTNPACLLGIFMTLNFYLASRSWSALLFAAWCLVFLRISVGAKWGLDPLLARFLPERLVYFPRK
jgi:thiosulfate dehydrogenase [quinone] large subunit